MELLEIIESSRPDDPFLQHTLQSLYAECTYYCNNNGSHKHNLLAGSEIKQIACIKAIWNRLPAEVRPPWLSYEEIETLEKQMRVHRAIRDYMVFEEDTNAKYPFAKRFGELTETELADIAESCQGCTDTETIQCALGDVIGNHPSLCENGTEEEEGHG